jgi:fructokinase
MTAPTVQPAAAMRPRFLVVGESLVDFITDAQAESFTARAGGSPCNVALGMAHLGHAVTLVTEYGDDLCGRILASLLSARGVDVSRRRHTTSIAFSALDTGGAAASYDFWFHWGLRADDHHIQGPFAGMHTGSLSCLVSPGRTAVLAIATEVRRQGIAVSFDPNIRPSLAPRRSVARRIVEQFVAASTIVKASNEDMAWLYPGEDPKPRLRRWAADGEHLIVLTDGPRGCVAFTSAHEISVPAHPVEVVDTVGAGDSFAAALLGHLETTGDLQTAAKLPARRLRLALEFASRAAAVTCARAGAYQPSLADVEGLQQRRVS